MKNEQSAIAWDEGRDRATSPFHIVLDSSAGIIRTSVSGFCSIADASTYFERLRSLIEDQRRCGRRVRVLVDRRGSPVQAPEIARRMERANEELFLPDDRLAILVGSRLVRMQIERLFSHQGSRAFVAMDKAVAWLEA